MVETPDNVGDHVPDHKCGKAAIGKTMGTRAEAFFNRPNGVFDFADVGISGHHVHVCRMNIVSNALKFLITVDVTHSETAGSVELDDSVNLLEYGFARSVRNRCDGEETNVAGDGV